MTRWRVSLASVVACTLTFSAAYAQDARKFTTDATLLQFLDELAEATHQFNVGNPQPYLALLSPREDLTLMGAAGGKEKGIAQIKPRLELLTKRRTQGEQFQQNRAVIEYVSIVVSVDLAYSVQIERRTLSVPGQAQPKDDVLRATHVMRKENGQWRLVHRHADPLIENTVQGLPTGRAQ